MPQSPPTPRHGAAHETAKAFGAYYTDAVVARFLVRWALRSRNDTLADPAFGGGVFLAAASDRLKHLGGDVRRQIFGVELDKEVHTRTAAVLESHFSINPDHLIHGDFFDIEPHRLRLNAVVGNPPFIRYQRFSGIGRDKAIRRAAEQGVFLSKLSSSWGAFVVQAAALLEPGGRLGMVVPTELGHASYARPVLEYLARSFEQVSFITFRERLFPRLSQDTLLLLAEGRKERENRAFFALLDLKSPADLATRTIPCRDGLRPYTMRTIPCRDGLRPYTMRTIPCRDRALAGLFTGLRLPLRYAEELEAAGASIPTSNGFIDSASEMPCLTLEASALTSGRERLSLYWIPRAARELYQGLRETPQTFRLGKVADVGIGYVTGHNNFFHLSPKQAEQWNIPQEFLKPAVRRGRALGGLRFTEADWKKAVQKGEGGFLLHIPPRANLPPGVQQYLQQGQQNCVHQAYKCRVRQPWYSVPHVYQPDGFLTYMSGHTPLLVANQAMAVAPNSLHILRLKEPGVLSAKALAALWQTSLTRLSAELEGHAMGGGMLKIEPGEAEKIVLAKPADTTQLEALADELDVLMKKGMAEQAQTTADQVILGGLGLSKKEIAALSQAAKYLSQRRQRKLAGF